MIGLPAGTRIWIARRSHGSAAWLYRAEWHGTETLQENPFSGHVFVFRGRRGDLIKMLWWPAMGYVFSQNGSTRKIHLAASDKRNSVAYASTVIDVA